MRERVRMPVFYAGCDESPMRIGWRITVAIAAIRLQPIADYQRTASYQR
jgi:hypothetical protein